MTQEIVTAPDPRQRTIDAIDGLFSEITQAASSPYVRNSKWRSRGLLGIPLQNTGHAAVDIPIEDERAELTVARTARFMPLMGIAVYPVTNYQVIYAHQALDEPFTKDTPEEVAPRYGYEHWSFSSRSSNLALFTIARRFDRYCIRGAREQFEPDSRRYETEHHNMQTLLGKALKAVV